MLKKVDYRDIFNDYARELWPYLIGANCYQHVLGIATIPVCLAYRRSDTTYIMHFLSLMPGFSKNVPLDDNELKNSIISGCKIDGLTDLGTDQPEFKEGHKTIAFLFSEHAQNFHFCALNKDMTWDEKTPVNPPTLLKKLENHEEYELVTYFSKPDDWKSVGSFPNSNDVTQIANENVPYNIMFLHDRLNKKDRHGLNSYCLEFKEGQDYGIVRGSAIKTVPVPDFAKDVLDYAVEYD